MSRYLEELRRRLRGPQRHRLLQGYPQPALMKPYDRRPLGEMIELDRESQGLLVGVLPHSACNPRVTGCGYCTFPHEEFQVERVRATVQAVIQEVSQSPCRYRKVEALYFGGGTANLTPPDLFAELLTELKRRFGLSGAEVTLEGAPVHFYCQRESLLEILQRELPGLELRLSMGVQTFDTEQITRMGRQHIGGPTQVERAVAAAQRRGITTSADLMINLPGQSLERMQGDLRRASELGFDQVCIYHLVLFRGLDVPWARDRDLLAALPDNERAFENWREIRQLAEQLGYRQTTLTNFQRHGRFRYEDCSYQPHRYDWAGFGPEALSCFTDMDYPYGVKWMNESDSDSYRHSMQQHKMAEAYYFLYDTPDLCLLFLTRGLARLRVNRAEYRQCYGTDLVADFGEQWRALEQEDLVQWNDHELWLTERGMFFADSVVGLLAWDRVAELRQGGGLDHAPGLRMG